MQERELALAYLAGVIDSDGSISIAIDTWRVRTKGYSAHYSEQVHVGQCDTQALELLKELFGGHIGVQKPGGERRRTIYIWGTTDRNAVRVLRELLPYLRIKRGQAELVLELRSIKDQGREVNTYLEETLSERMTRWGVRTYRRRHLRPEIAAEYDRLARAVRGLNDTRFPFPPAAD